MHESISKSLLESLARVKKQDREGSSTLSLSLIRDDAVKAHVDNTTPELLARMFFETDDLVSDRAGNGVVETPSSIADLMVRLSANEYAKNNPELFDAKQNANIRWLDQCTGAGAFAIAILRHYLEVNGRPDGVECLPRITIMDINPCAVFISLCAIKSVIQSTTVSLADYISSGRLSYHVNDALLCNETSSDLFRKNEQYDIVIGNPPYVRSSRIDSAYRGLLRRRFRDTYCGSADLYTYFIASGIGILRPQGVLTYISAASFGRTKSGSAIRTYIEKTSAITTYIDFDELAVFCNAEVHAAIYVLKKGVKQNEAVTYLHVKSKEQLTDLLSQQSHLSEKHHIDMPASLGWSFHRSKTNLNSFRRKYTDNCRPLSSFGFNIYSGIRPGVSKAFIIDKRAMDLFSHRTQTDWLKPIILPFRIQRWQGATDVNYLIFTPKSASTPPLEIMQHLIQHFDRLSKRAEVSNPDDWYKLRSCGYYDKMLASKIIFPDLSAAQRFSLCDPGVLISDGAYFIDSDDRVLLGILNSETAKMYFVKKCSSVGNLESKGRFRFKKTFINDFPLPQSFMSNKKQRDSIESLVRLIQANGETPDRLNELNCLVDTFYGHNNVITSG